jgi:hypothetical protein
MAKLETTSAGDATAQRKGKADSSNGNGGTGGSSDSSSNGDASSAGRQRVVAGGNAGAPLISDGLASSSSASPEGAGGLSRGGGNGDRGARLDRVWPCAARGSWARTGSAEQDTSGGDTERTT